MTGAWGRTSRSAALTRSARDPHSVYHCYDADNRLLYVGCTSNLKRRIAQHQHATPTAALASRVLSVFMTTVFVASEHVDRASAQAAEARDIEALRPLLNQQLSFAPGWRVLGAVERYLKTHGADPATFDLSRCENCETLRGYRAEGSLCTDCRDPEFRAYLALHGATTH